MVDNSQEYSLGIVEETKNPWERRVAFTPSDISKLTAKGVKVKVQPSDSRCFTDGEYREARAEISKDLSDCDVISAIKPMAAELMLPGKTYLIYSRIHTGSESIVDALRDCINKKICLLDYEMMRDPQTQQICVGSSKLAGTVGMFDVFRLVGELLLLQKNINTPFLFTGGSAYMHEDLSMCQRDLKRVGELISKNGLPSSISPFVIGISGNGVVAQGAKELLKENLPFHKLESLEELKNLTKNAPEDANKKIFIYEFGRKQYLKKKDGSEFDAKDYDRNIDLYENHFASEILPYLSIFANGVGWKKGTHKLLTNEDLKKVGKDLRLLAITDVSALPNGPIELYQRESEMENPYFLFNAETCEIYNNFHQVPKGVRVTGYTAVEQLPAGLPKDASAMFSGELTKHIEAVLKATKEEKTKGFEEAWKDVPLEMKNSVTTTFEGKCGPCFQYLNPLI